MKNYLHAYVHSSTRRQKSNAAGSAPDATGETVETTPQNRAWRFPPRSVSLFWIILFTVTILLASLATITQPEREEIWTKVAQQAREIIIEQTENTFEGLFDPSEMLKTVARYFLQCRYMKDRRSREHVLPLLSS